MLRHIGKLKTFAAAAASAAAEQAALNETQSNMRLKMCCRCRADKVLALFGTLIVTFLLSLRIAGWTGCGLKVVKDAKVAALLACLAAGLPTI